VSKPSRTKSRTSLLSRSGHSTRGDDIDPRRLGYDDPSLLVTERLCQFITNTAALLKTITREEPVSRSRFIDCPSCKTRSLKLKRVVQTGRCKSCHESYRVVIVYVKEGKKSKPDAKPESVKIESSSSSTLPSWQMPSDNSLFGPSPTETTSLPLDYNSVFGQDSKDQETSTGA
jgi:hypothetical protein